MHTNKDGCPRGFVYDQEKGECIPDRTGVNDRLTQRYERYFFKEQEEVKPIKGKTDTVPACPKGYKW